MIPEAKKDVYKDRGGSSSEGMKQPNADMRCYNCLEIGHHQYVCTNESVCYKCRDKGHLAVDCPNKGSKKLKMYGFGIPGQGFYAFDFSISKGNINQASGLITILEGEANEDRLDKELKHLVKESWDFQVRRIDRNEFLVVFPDKTSLDTFSRLTGFEMSLFGLKGKIVKAARDTVASSMLQTVWIKILEVPDLAREVETIKEIAALVAEPLVVDELSLIRVGPVRFQGRCRNPAAINGYIEFFFNGEGVKLKFEVVDYLGVGKGGEGGPPGPGRPDDS